MGTHGAGDPAPAGGWGGHERAVRHMVAAAALIGPDVIGPDHRAVIGDKYGVAWRVPIGKRLRLGPVRRQRVGFTGPDRGHDDPSDRLVIAGERGAGEAAGGLIFAPRVAA